MGNYEEQRNEIHAKNEKNRAFQKRMKIYYVGLIAPWLVSGLLALLARDAELEPNLVSIILVIAVVLIIFWFVWIIIGLFLTRCPHCGSFLYGIRTKIRYCPHCATELEVIEEPDDTMMR